jgi:hydroxyacylglutathione hydrolase
MTSPRVIVVPVLHDNYAYAVVSGHDVLIIDPGEAAPVVAAIEKNNLTPRAVLITHYDHDHTGGVAELRRIFNMKVIGPSPSPLKMDEVCQSGQILPFNNLQIKIIDTPGHAFPHVAFYESTHRWLFSGDCLFGAGCGWLSGSSAPVMWKSIQSLAALPDDTSMFFGHEYTLSNLSFAASVEPENNDIPARRLRVEEHLSQGGFSSPSTMGEERATNPFLRVNSPDIRRRLNLADASDQEVFTALRIAKNSFS